MIWGWYGQELPALPDYDTVLGFNEPNHATQANLSPQEAALGWMELQAAYPDKTLVSPSASPPNTEEWFDEVFEIFVLRESTDQVIYQTLENNLVKVFYVDLLGRIHPPERQIVKIRIHLLLALLVFYLNLTL